MGGQKGNCREQKTQVTRSMERGREMEEADFLGKPGQKRTRGRGWTEVGSRKFSFFFAESEDKSTTFFGGDVMEGE